MRIVMRVAYGVLHVQKLRLVYKNIVKTVISGEKIILTTNF